MTLVTAIFMIALIHRDHHRDGLVLVTVRCQLHATAAGAWVYRVMCRVTYRVTFRVRYRVMYRVTYRVMYRVTYRVMYRVM